MKSKQSPRWLHFMILGIVVIILVDWWYAHAIYEITNYAKSQKTSEEYLAIFRGPIFLTIWHFLHRFHEEVIAAATVTIFIVTASLAYYTFQLWDEGRRGSRLQAVNMRKSLKTSRDSANAMQAVAEATKNNAVLMQAMLCKQMRAYLTVSIGTGLYQDQAKGLKFAVHPAVMNTGHTPAHKMHYWARAAILPFPLPPDFEFTIHENPVKSSMLMGPHQGIELNAVVDDFVPDEEVVAIKRGVPNRVHIWGIITYTDAFDEVHTTKFCHSIFWFQVPENGVMVDKISGTYSYHHNEAT